MQNNDSYGNKSQLISTKVFQNLGFDLRTLLNGFVGPIQLLKFKLDDPDLVEIFRLLDSSLFRLERLANRSVIVSNLELQTNSISKKPINIVDVARYSILELQTISDLENVKINVEADVTPVTIYGDYDLLIQTFEILFELSISLSLENTQVEVSFSEKNQKVICTIYSPTANFSSDINLVDEKESELKDVSWGVLLAINILQKHNAIVRLADLDGNSNSIEVEFSIE